MPGGFNPNAAYQQIGTDTGQIIYLQGGTYFDINGNVINPLVTVPPSQLPTTTGAIPFGNGVSLTNDAVNLYWDNLAKALSIGGVVNQTTFPGTVASLSLGAASQGYTQHIITDITAAGQSVYVCNANDATNTTHYCQLSMNNSVAPNPANVFFVNPHATALYNSDAELDIAAAPGGSTPAAVINLCANGIVAQLVINPTNVTATVPFFPQQAVTGSAPAYVKGGMYFDTTLNKLRIGGATAWETVTSV